MSAARTPRPSRSPRVAAAQVVGGVLEGQSLTSLVPQQLGAIEDPRDRALAQELSYGALRYYPRLEALLAHLLEKPLKRRDRDVMALLLIGCYQLLYLRVADHAAVNETAGAAKVLGKRGKINGQVLEQSPVLGAGQLVPAFAQSLIVLS